MSNTIYQRPPVKVAIMGCGRAIFEDHFPVFAAHPGLFKVVAACDLIKERRDRIAKVFPEMKHFRRFEDMLDERDIDIVDIASASYDHVEHALASLKRGYWTLLESPMALSVEDAAVIRGAATKAKNRLLVMQRGMFAPDFMLAKQEMNDIRLGPIYDISIRREDFIRRDDWQTVKRLGGGAAYYAMPDLIMQALKLLPLPPTQMWSDLKRIASLGDVEDFVRINLRTRGAITADIEFNGGALPPHREPSFVIRGERGYFEVMPGATTGHLRVIDPDYSFPRRRSSVRTPPLEDLHENFPIMDIEVSLPHNALYGQSAFWKHVYDTVRTAAPFPFSIDESIETVKFSRLMKKGSPFG